MMYDRYSPYVIDFVTGNVIHESGRYFTKQQLLTRVLEYGQELGLRVGPNLNPWPTELADRIFCMVCDAWYAVKDITLTTVIGARLRSGKVVSSRAAKKS